MKKKNRYFTSFLSKNEAYLEQVIKKAKKPAIEPADFFKVKSPRQERIKNISLLLQIYFYNVYLSNIL